MTDSPLEVPHSLIHQADAGGERDRPSSSLVVGQMKTMDAANPNCTDGRPVACPPRHGVFQRCREHLDLLPENTGGTTQMLPVGG